MYSGQTKTRSVSQKGKALFFDIAAEFNALQSLDLLFTPRFHYYRLLEKEEGKGGGGGGEWLIVFSTLVINISGRNLYIV